MKCGPISTTLEQRKKVHPGGPWSPPQRRYIRLNPSEKWCSSFFFLMNVESSTCGYIQKRIITSEHYCEILKTLFTLVAKKRPELKKKFILHRENVHLHNFSKMIAFLTEHESRSWSIPLQPWPHTMWFLALSAPEMSTSKIEIRHHEAVVAAAKFRFSFIDLSKFAKTWVKWRKKWNKCTTSHYHYLGEECSRINFCSWLLDFCWGTLISRGVKSLSFTQNTVKCQQLNRLTWN